MKPLRIFLFVCSVLLCLVGVWYVFPKDGIRVGNFLTLRFHSYEADLEKRIPPVGHLDFDTLFPSDSLSGADDAHMISVPDGDYSFFSDLFSSIEKAGEEDRVVHIFHYGDSQLEGDRISGAIRQRLQEKFGGGGCGMVPFHQRIATYSLSQWNGGAFRTYSVVTDSSTGTISSGRYGPLCQVSITGESASLGFRQTRHRLARPLSKNISRVSLLVGRNSGGFSATLSCDGSSPERKTLGDPSNDVSMLEWKLPSNVTGGTLSLKGSAEVYGVSFDADAGVTVDNIPLRGSSGTFFSSLDSASFAQCYRLLDTRLIILEFGCNHIPVLHTDEDVDKFVSRMEGQMRWFRSVAPPSCRILFIGPGDMTLSRGGQKKTYPTLPYLDKSLRRACLSCGVAYWDLFKAMGGEGSMQEWVEEKQPPLGGPDYTHFSFEGATLVGEMFADALLSYYDMYCKSKGR